MHRVVLVAAIPALLITGCAATPVTPTAAATQSAPASPAGTKSSATPASSKSSGTPDCAKADLTAGLTAQDVLYVGKEIRVMIGLTNAGKTTCKVSGWVTPVLSNAHGDDLPVKIEKVEEPGPAVTIVLKPGRTALAGMKWTQCDKGDSNCLTGNAVVIAEASKSKLYQFPPPEKPGISFNEVQVGTLQPSNQGVVAW